MSNLIDLTGMKFGRLTVIEGAESHVTPGGTVRSRWTASCDCGAVTTVYGISLRSGATRSCGCLKRENGKAAAMDLTGHHYGRWLVLERKDSKTWICVCVCGTRRAVKSGDLRQGKSKSCGCWNRERAASVTGEQHQSWTDSPKYKAVHARLRRYKGRAADRVCVDCGSPAEDWSHVHGCGSEVYEIDRNGNPLVYCAHLEHFEPRCKPCHRTHDAKDFTGQSVVL